MITIALVPGNTEPFVPDVSRSRAHPPVDARLSKIEVNFGGKR
jgi:hypothetical protein